MICIPVLLLGGMSVAGLIAMGVISIWTENRDEKQ